jgi:hypothetical protein
LCSSLVPPYYGGRPLAPEDFDDPAGAARLLADPEEGQVRLLALPAGHIGLPNRVWVAEWMERLSPWRAAAIERWRKKLRQDQLWLNAVRVHAGSPVAIKLPKGSLPQARVKPFRLAQLKPVLAEEVFATRAEELVQQVSRGMAPAPTREKAPAPGEDLAAQTGYEPAQLQQFVVAPSSVRPTDCLGRSYPQPGLPAPPRPVPLFSGAQRAGPASRTSQAAALCRPSAHAF